MPRADHVAALIHQGKLHTYVRVVKGATDKTTNTVATATETEIDGYGVYQDSKETAVAGVAILEGDEVLLFDATPLQDVDVTPKAGDALQSTDGTGRRLIVAREPKRGTDGDVWFYRLLLRGKIDG